MFAIAFNLAAKRLEIDLKLTKNGTPRTFADVVCMFFLLSTIKLPVSLS